MHKRTKQLLVTGSLLAAAMSVHAAGLDLTDETSELVDTLESIGLPALIVAISVGVFGYWFKFVSLGFAGAIVIGGIIFANAADIANLLLT